VTLDRAIAAFMRVGLDVTVGTVLDALWLATQATVDIAGDLVFPSGDGADGNAAKPPGVPPPMSSERPPVDRSRPIDEPMPGADGSVPVYAGASGSDEGLVRASPIRLPAGAALPGKLALSRAMRPFTERWPSRRLLELDEEASAEATANQAGRVTPVFRPRSERWYEAALVVEDAPSMDLWHDTLDEFRQVLLQSGAFSDVRLWYLSFAPDKEGVQVPVIHNSTRGRASLGSIVSVRARRLVFLATHGVSPLWSDGTLARTLADWSAAASVVLLHLLPPHLWRHTALGEPRGLAHVLEAGAPTSRLVVQRFAWDWSLDEQDPVTAVPVVPLDAVACINWAQMQMARGRRAPVMLLRMAGADDGAPAEDTGKADETQLISLFKTYASPLAFRLAVYLSPGPFTLPVARLIQAAIFGAQAQQSQLAEVFLSGLVARLTAEGTDVHPDWVQYEIRAGAREILLRSLREEDALAVLSVLQQHVGQFIEQTFGKPLDFRALVRDENGQFDLPTWAQPFANIGTSIIRMQDVARTPVSSRTGAAAGPSARAAVEEAADLRAILEQHFGKDGVAARIGRAPEDLAPDARRDYLLTAGVRLISVERRGRFAVLGVSEPVALPSALWRRLVSPSDFAPLDRMGGLTILGDDSLVVADAVRNELFRYLTPDERAGQHLRIVDAYGDFRDSDVPDDGYHYQFYLRHAAAANHAEVAESAVFNRAWLTKKLETCGIEDVVADLQRFPSNARIRGLLEVVLARQADFSRLPLTDWVRSLLETPLDSGERAEREQETAADVPSFWVRIVGTGLRTVVDEQLKAITVAIAERLADMGIGLVTSGGRGVEPLAADAYARVRVRRGLNPDDGLIHVLRGGETSASRGTKRVARAEADFNDLSLERVDAVILIGGREYTLQAGRRARSWGIPVIPVAASGGAARTFFETLVERHDYAYDDVLATAPIPGALAALADRVGDIIVGFQKDPPRILRSMSETYLNTYDLNDADRIDARIVATLQQHPSYVFRDWLVIGDSVDQVLEAFCIRLQPRPEDIASILKDLDRNAMA
jgi:hypothetical protein